MKTIIWMFLACLMAMQVEAVSFYVAPDGNDGNPGTQSKPFATVERASRAVRDVKSDEDEVVRVNLRGGTYYLSDPVVLKPADIPAGGVIFSSYEDEQVVISGGRLLALKWQAHENGIVKATVPADVGAMDVLFVDGRRMHMARYPNYDADARFFGGTSGDAISPERAKGWSNPAGGYMHALHSAMWGSKHYRIAGVDSEGNIRFQGGWQENRGGGFDTFFRGGYHKDHLFVENIFEELDTENEWYLDTAARTLYLKPASGVDVNKAEVVAAGLLELVVVEGSADKPVRNVTFEGLTFRHTRRVFMEPYERLLRGDWSIARRAAVRFDGCEDCSVKDCSFEDLGGNGVFLSNYNRRVDVTGSRFTRLGESGVCVVGSYSAVRSGAVCYDNTLPQDEIDLTPGPKSPDYPAQCRIHNNLMHRFGIIGKQVAGVVISMAQEITVSHNTIYQCPRAAICINDGCWGGHVIEYNDAFNTVRESGDHGPFNSWGRDRWWKTSYNGGRDIEEFAKERSCLDNYKVTHIRNNRFSHPGGHSWGIDLDDGSSNYRVYNNLCLGMGVKLREGFHRRVENNIMINGFGGFHIWMPGCDDVVARNIVVNDRPWRFIRANPEYAKEIDYNLFYTKGAEPMVMGVDSPMTLTQWREKGFDVHSVLADPQFMDPANGDYRVRPGSPALKLGFVNFDMNQFGVLKPAFQVEAAKESRMFKPAATETAESRDRSNEPLAWLGATVKNLVGEAEKSAAGIGQETGVLFVRVPADSIAARAGFETGDLILALAGEKVHSLEDLMRLTKANAGRRIQATVHRATERTVQVKLPKQEDR